MGIAWSPPFFETKSFVRVNNYLHTKKKGNNMSQTTPEVKKVVTQVDKSTKLMTKVVSDLTKVMSELTSLTATSEALAFDIEEKSSELKLIEMNITESERKAKAELNLRILENADAVLNELMSARKLARISNADLNELRCELEDAKADNTETIATAVEKAEKAGAIAKSAAESKLTSEHAVATARLEADNSSLQSKITFLESSVDDLKAMLKAEREARVEMSKNASQPTINIDQKK